jgi:chromosome segregation ATPase
MVIPDLTELDANVAKIKSKMIGIQEEIKNRQYEIEQLKNDGDFAKFLALYGKIKSGEIRLSTEQAENWQKLVTKNSRPWNQVENVNKQILGLERLKQEAEAEVTKISESRDAAAVGISCVIDTLKGLTRGQTMTSAIGLRVFDGMSGTDALMSLRNFDHHKQKVFSADNGSIHWQYQ